MALSLSASVGSGGTNRPDDVRAVQEAMRTAEILAPGLLTPGIVDGLCGPGTIGDITEVQRYILHAYKPDGRIDVGGKTHRALSACVSIAADPWTFPLAQSATAPYMGSGAGQRAFRFRRSGGERSHAGRDLYEAVGTPVYAVAPGRVVSTGGFYLKTNAVVIEHTAPDGHRYCVRYGEVDPAVPVRVGQVVEREEMVGRIGQMIYSNGTRYPGAMLHGELFLFGADAGPLTDDGRGSARDRVNGRPFVRRFDVVDPGGKLLAAPYPTPGGCS